MIRPHADLEAFVSKNLSLRAGLSLVDFPSGAINSFNFNIGATINTNTYLVNNIKTSEKGTSNSFFNILKSMLFLVTYLTIKRAFKNRCKSK